MFHNIFLQSLSMSLRREKTKVFHIRKKSDFSLQGHLHAKIKFTGPMTVYEYMKEVLTNPISGYYMKKNVFGEKGDFITSPEISQMFGELIGIWIYSEWQKMGAPRPFQLIEFGPGTGSLMQDILRVMKQLKVGKSEFEIHLVEKSLFMSNEQEETLCHSSSQQINTAPDQLKSPYKSAKTVNGIPLHWHYHLNDIPSQFSMVIAHEFFDALPIHKLKKTNNGWREVLIDIKSCEKGEGKPEEEELRYVISRGPTPASKLFVDELEKRDEIEVSPDGGVLIQQLSQRLEENGGGVLIIDYGHDGTLGDTFRAFKDHKQVSPLVSLGDADLSSDVDFSYLKKHAQDKMLVFGPVSQAFFLKNMGIELRLQKLLQNCTSTQLHSLSSSYKMLVDPQQMGERFKVMALLPKVMKEVLMQYPPAGFYQGMS